VHAVAFSPDGRSLASAGGQHFGEKAGDTSVHLWELATGQERGRLGGNHRLGMCLAFAPNGNSLALGSSDGAVRLWDTIAGKELRRFEGHRGVVKSVAFSGDGKRLVSGSADTTVLIWDTDGLVSHTAPVATLAADAIWANLASPDAKTGFAAIGSLRANPADAVTFLRERLEVPAAQSNQIVAGLLKQLDSPQFAEREKAQKKLTSIVQSFMFATELAEAMKGNLSEEVRARLDQVLISLNTISPERLRYIRACEALEGIATSDALKVLQTWSAGPDKARLTIEAKESLQRLGAR
jgi:predicted NACHT family NTPase